MEWLSPRILHPCSSWSSWWRLRKSRDYLPKKQKAGCRPKHTIIWVNTECLASVRKSRLAKCLVFIIISRRQIVDTAWLENVSLYPINTHLIILNYFCLMAGVKMSYFKYTNNNWGINTHIFILLSPVHLGTAI